VPGKRGYSKEAVDPDRPDGLQPAGTMDRDRIVERIRGLVPELSGQMATAALHIVSHADDVAVYSMREIARNANVRPVAFVRLSQRLGLPGYGELRKNFIDAVLKRANGSTNASTRNIESARAILTSAKAKKGALGFSNAFIAAEHEVLRRTSIGLTEDLLIRAVDKLVSSNKIFVVGRRTAYSPAFTFAYALLKARANVILLDDHAGAPEAPLEDVAKGDLLVAFTFAPFSRVTDQLARRASAGGADVITITDSTAAPLRGVSGDLLFVAPTLSQAFPETVTGAIVIANLLVALTVARLGHSANKRIEQNERFLVESGEYLIKKTRVKSV
jgi:DNA-binding MurR/RpiR family transcriptional regulator